MRVSNRKALLTLITDLLQVPAAGSTATRLASA